MGYLFLAVSVLSGSKKGFFAKKVSDRTSGLRGAVLSNLIRMLFCIPIGLVFVLFDGKLADLAVSPRVIGISAFAGVSTAVFIVSWLLAVKRSAFTSVDTFISLGILVPIILSLAFYGEKVSLSQIIGLCLLISAVVIMSMYNNQIKERLDVASLILLLIVGFSNGLTDFSYKIFQYTKSGTPASVFNFYIYVFSAIALLGVLGILHLRGEGSEKPENDSADVPSLLDRRKVIYIAIMAVFLFSNSYFKTLASARLSAAEVYPLAQGSAIVLTLLMSRVFFGEKIKPLCLIGLGVLFSALLLLNVIVF
ncbi:MAG: EamA family transporter [Clostridia bacterium]|nr:EamA family transporter [Clostridia bacterium]